jgi:hypothetical protein
MLTEITKQCKSAFEKYEPELYVGSVVILVAFLAFGPGRMSEIENGREPVRIEQTVTTSTDGQARLSDGQVVASNTGTKYHLPWCSGAQRISEANKIYFASKAEAEKAGYAPAANCKGL